MDALFKLEHFEGPLDLLLHLIEKNKINIYDIPIFEITEQYLAYIAKMDEANLDIASEFLVMAATLIEIKSKMLLPKEVDESTGEEVDPREELVHKLLEHKRFKNLAMELSDLELMADRYVFKEPTIPKEVQEFEETVDLDELLSGVSIASLREAFEQAIKRSENRIDKVRSNFGTIKKEPISLEEQIARVLEILKAVRRCKFREFLENRRSKLEIVVTFLVVLELMKIGKVHIEQDEIFGEIYIEGIDDTLDYDGIDFAGILGG